MNFFNHVIASHHVTWPNSEHSSCARSCGRPRTDYSHGVTENHQLINKLDRDPSNAHTAKSYQSDPIPFELVPQLLSELLQTFFMSGRKQRQVCRE